MEKILKHKVVITALISFFALPAFYMIGMAFHGGTLNAYDISSDIFPISTSDTYIHAYYFVILFLSDILHQIISFLSTLLGITITLASILTLILIISVISILEKNPVKTQNTWLKKLKKYRKTHLFIATHLTTKLCSIIYITFQVTAVGWLCLILIFKLPFDEGKSLAQEKINKYLEKGCYYDEETNWNNCKVLLTYDNKKLVEGIFITQNTTHIAFFTKEGSQVIKHPNDVILKSLYNNKK